ncbi:MAG TPA: hypothetical protein VF058_11485 [Actinomycetota bacterium]
MDARYRWFVGPSEPESLAEVVDLLDRRRGFVLAHWGAEDVAGHEAGVRVEVGDRAYVEMLRESDGSLHQRLDPILERAVRARPLSLLDLV